MKMKINTIVTDLDQTLLHTDKTISYYTVGALTRCREAGKRIVFATARSTQASIRFLERFKPDIFIGYGGALVQAEGKVIYRFDIPADISSRLITDCLNTPEIISVYGVSESVALTNDADKDSSPNTNHYQYTGDLLEHSHHYLKISVTSKSQEAVERIAADYPMCDMLRYTGEDLYRFANRDALKWNAVKAVAEYYSLSTDTFVAFGDDINDLEMVQNCGVGVAVSNAVEDVKAVADYVCDTNDNDGLAKWLLENVL